MKVIQKENFDMSDPRFVIADDDGNVIDDAQGFGYKSRQKAHKFISYKYKRGRQKKQDKSQFFKQNPEIKNAIDEILEINVKEIARGEIKMNEIKEFIDQKFDIDLPKGYLK